MAKYIDKDALVAEIKRIINEQQEICKTDVALGKNPDSKNIEVIYQFQHFAKFIDALEVKEVDIAIPNMDDLFEEAGIDPDSKEAKVFKECYYIALEKLKEKKGE